MHTILIKGSNLFLQNRLCMVKHISIFKLFSNLISYQRGTEVFSNTAKDPNGEAAWENSKPFYTQNKSHRSRFEKWN